MVEAAAKCLDEITKEMANNDSNTSGATAAAPSHNDKQKEKDESDSSKSKEESKTEENSAEKENLATSLLIHVPQHKGRHPKTQTLISNKMPQHHVMVGCPRRIVILYRIHQRIGSPIS